MSTQSINIRPRDAITHLSYFLGVIKLFFLVKLLQQPLFMSTKSNKSEERWTQGYNLGLEHFPTT